MSENFDKQYENYFNQPEQVESQESPEVDPSAQNDSPEPTENNDTEQEESILITDSEEDKAEEVKEEPVIDKTTEIANNLKAALKEERGKRQELDKQLKHIQQESQQIKEALNALLAPKQEPQNIPRYEEDPVGYLKWQQDQIVQAQQQQTNYTKQQQQQLQAYQEAVNLNNEYMTEKQDYVKENPDFENAASFLEKSVLNEYKALGYNEKQASELLIQDKLSLLANAKQNGLSAVEMINQIAIARGYTSNQPPISSSKLENVKNGINKAKTLGTVGGTPPSQGISLKEISNLDDKEFDKIFKQYAKGNLQAM